MTIETDRTNFLSLFCCSSSEFHSLLWSIAIELISMRPMSPNRHRCVNTSSRGVCYIIRDKYSQRTHELYCGCGPWQHTRSASSQFIIFVGCVPRSTSYKCHATTEWMLKMLSQQAQLIFHWVCAKQRGTTNESIHQIETRMYTQNKHLKNLAINQRCVSFLTFFIPWNVSQISRITAIRCIRFRCLSRRG